MASELMGYAVAGFEGSDPEISGVTTVPVLAESEDHAMMLVKAKHPELTIAGCLSERTLRERLDQIAALRNAH